MKRISLAVVALFVFAGMSQAALFTVPASVSRYLDPVLLLLGRGSLSSFLHSLGIGQEWVEVKQSVMGGANANQAVPVPQAGRAEPQVSSKIEPLPVAVVSPAVQYVVRQPVVEVVQVVVRQDGGQHRGWYRSQKGWRKQQSQPVRKPDSETTDDPVVRIPELQPAPVVRQVLEPVPVSDDNTLAGPTTK